MYVLRMSVFQLYGSDIPIDERTSFEIERDEEYKKIGAVKIEEEEENMDHLLMPRADRENILGKNFATGRRHRPLPHLKDIVHYPPSQVGVSR